MRQQIRIKNMMMKGLTSGRSSEGREAHLLFYAKPKEIDIIEVYPNFLLIEITTATGNTRRECINASAIYDGEIVIEDMQGRTINPWKDFIAGQKDSKEEAWARWRRWTKCEHES